MTKNPPTRRHYARRSQRVRVTTQSAVTLTQILTGAALQKALLEAEAEADHVNRRDGRASERRPSAGVKLGADRA